MFAVVLVNIWAKCSVTNIEILRKVGVPLILRENLLLAGTVGCCVLQDTLLSLERWGVLNDRQLTLTAEVVTLVSCR